MTQSEIAWFQNWFTLLQSEIQPMMQKLLDLEAKLDAHLGADAKEKADNDAKIVELMAKLDPAVPPPLKMAMGPLKAMPSAMALLQQAWKVISNPAAMAYELAAAKLMLQTVISDATAPAWEQSLAQILLQALLQQVPAS